MPPAAPPHELALLAQAVGVEGASLLHPHLDPIELADGDTVFVDGAPSDHLVLIVSGVLAIQHVAEGRVLEIATRGPGSWLGEVSLIDPGPATATVVCRGPVRLLQLEHQSLLDLTTDRPEVASVLLRHVTRQLAERLAMSSSGVVERVGPGQVRFRKPEEVRGWVSTVLGWLVGGNAP